MALIVCPIHKQVCFTWQAMCGDGCTCGLRTIPMLPELVDEDFAEFLPNMEVELNQCGAEELQSSRVCGRIV